MSALLTRPEPSRRASSALFEHHQIRGLYDDATETWWFSVIDIVQALNQTRDFHASRK